VIGRGSEKPQKPQYGRVGLKSRSIFTHAQITQSTKPQSNHLRSGRINYTCPYESRNFLNLAQNSSPLRDTRENRDPSHQRHDSKELFSKRPDRSFQTLQTIRPQTSWGMLHETKSALKRSLEGSRSTSRERVSVFQRIKI
jgi:hypothetical protein